MILFLKVSPGWAKSELSTATTRHLSVRISKRQVSASMVQAAASLMVETSCVHSRTLCQLFLKRCWCSVHPTWDWCHLQVAFKSCHLRQSQVKHQSYRWAPTRIQISQSKRSTKKRTRRLCRCKLPCCLESSRSSLTTSKASLRSIKSKKSRTCQSQVKHLLKKSSSPTTSLKWYRKPRRKRVVRRAKETKEVIRARVISPTRRRSTTIEWERSKHW